MGVKFLKTMHNKKRLLEIYVKVYEFSLPKESLFDFLKGVVSSTGLSYTDTELQEAIK